MFLLLNPPLAEAPAVASRSRPTRKTGKPLIRLRRKVLPLRFKKQHSVHLELGA